MARKKKVETYDIPEWAIYFLEYWESDGLTEEEVDMITDFVEDKFPLGYTMDVHFDDYRDLDFYPAFGQACKTVKVDFYSRKR